MLTVANLRAVDNNGDSAVSSDCLFIGHNSTLNSTSTAALKRGIL